MENTRGVWEHFKGFLDAPFKDEMDFIDWFMFIGLLLVIMIVWNIILRHIVEAI